MPTNLYAPNDKFDLLSGLVLPAILGRSCRSAGRLRHRRDLGSRGFRCKFLHVDDWVYAVVFLMKTWSDEEPINQSTSALAPI
jgi:GDP-L-fucose synthase